MPTYEVRFIVMVLFIYWLRSWASLIEGVFGVITFGLWLPNYTGSMVIQSI